MNSVETKLISKFCKESTLIMSVELQCAIKK